MSYLKKTFYTILLTLSYTPIALGYTDRTLISYFTDNLIWNFLAKDIYISLGLLLASTVLSIFSKKLRTIIVSVFIALIAVYFLVLIYEVIEGMSWLPPMY